MDRNSHINFGILPNRSKLVYVLVITLHFENSLGPIKKDERGILFQTVLKEGSIFKLALKKYLRPGPRKPGPGPRPQLGICSKTV